MTVRSHRAAGCFPRVQPGPALGCGPRTALPRRRRRGPGPLIGVQSWAGEADRGARAAVAPAAGPRCSRAATVSGSSASLGGSLSVSFSPRTPPSFGRPGPSRTGPHRSAQGPRSPETRPPLGVRARAPGALQPPPQLLGLSPARVIEPAVPDTSQQLGDSPAS
ncbi:protein CEBPZOS isoform X1 [Cervus canadensis]|uniref:protein CEBPZOS isoform X1 n=1 Tax=Cervus canadensis TaxID=1574408 RepID=UPI001C9E5D2C|nr:protein CEBPZOS isoform X1 [Cervus canadensis]XP_043324277.1 protein CEBPZOS isoform X1 [Cervus canadensis]XP_043324278.1 protein CEBPZOS isoform X1 [Cervus canadensis]